MRKSFIVIPLCVALIFGLFGCSNDSKVTTKNISESIVVKIPNQEQIYKRDLNKDSVEEIIKVIFKYENQGPNTKKEAPLKVNGYGITVTNGGKEYTWEENSISNLIPIVEFADFDTSDKYIEFYIDSDGPSDDPGSAVYRFDDNGIIKICDTVGYIKEYDRVGKIYTDFSKTCEKYGVTLSYYDISKKCVEFINKSSLIGSKLQYDISLILFADSADLNSFCNSTIEDNLGKEEINKIVSSYNKDNIIKVCEPNEVLTIIDIDNTHHGMFMEGRERNIRIKVKTPEGKEGWLDCLNGGD